MQMVSESFLYHFFRNLFSIGLWVYFKKITVSGLENFPAEMIPVITTSNHPTGLMDVFLVGYHLKRQVKFTVAGSLFKDKLQAAFLTGVGAIPLYRRKDTPDEMDKNVESFENCFQELEAGGAIGFYPEGTSHPEPWVNPIKTGAARIAMQTEERNNFKLNLRIVPIGINSLKPGAFRDSVFVKFGNPISIQKYQNLYRKNPVEANEQLTAEIRTEMERCTFHIKNKSLLKFFEDFKIIGLDGVKTDDQNLKNNAAKYYSIIKILEDKITGNDKEASITKINSLTNKTGELKQQMQQLGLTDHPFKGIKTIVRTFYLFIISLLGLPFALGAAIVNVLPFVLAKNLGRKIAGKDISLIPAARLMSGVLIYFVYYLFLFIFTGIFTEFSKSLGISLALIIGGYLNLWYWEALKSFLMVSKKLYYWLTNKKMIIELIKQRENIIIELNSLLENKVNPEWSGING
jgi:1-acyl-sn-glycerol-3-phosphate acyltransferase